MRPGHRVIRLIWPLILACAGCGQIPEGITAVDDFEIERYLGVWYEIARLDHPFERGLTNITATHPARPDSDSTHNH